MDKSSWLEKKREEKQEVFFNTEANIKSTRVTMCQDGHKWRKFSENEVACTICPTINIVNNVNDYV